MKFNKSDILLALETITIAGEGENMVASGAVTNVMTFADEVVVDITMATPAMHIKKRAEADIIKTIQEKVFLKAKVQVNITVKAPAKPSNPNLIKGKPIPGIKNIIEWGTRNNDYIRPTRRNSKQVQQNKKPRT